ncbi:MAG: PocR ligand-binding domain-containing protein [Candidatus Omnitrophica bacterium]|nr:PocR ligand-binding domain-containing protein [Candidatus Omnitrophota bacterium]
MNQNEFFELIDSNKWKTIQEYFAQVIGASVRVIDISGMPLTVLSQPSNYCFETIFSSSKAFSVCNGCLILSPQPCSCDKLLTEKEHFIDHLDNIHYDVCPYYMNRVIIPIKSLNNVIKAYILIGPIILGKRRTYPEYFNLSQNLGLEINALIEAVEHVKVYSFASIKPIVQLFQEIANFMFQNGMDKVTQTSNPNRLNFDTQKTPEVPFYISKMLQALFETAGQGIDAERGSLMLFDSKFENLKIKLSKGIPEQIAQEAIVKKGEGLAGWAAVEGKVIFIDQNFKQSRLLSRLHQPQLSAALTVPLKSNNKVFGVLNLSTQVKKHKFNQENINSIMQLTKMVDSALVNIDLDTLAIQ